MSLRRYLPSLTLILVLLLLWEIIVRWRAVPAWILPPPTAIGRALIENRAILWPHIGQTMLEVVLGLSVAIVTGIGTAALLQFSPRIREALYPLLVTSQTIPIIALAPLLIIWFGFGIIPKVIVVTLFCYFPIAINTIDGFNSASPVHIDLIAALGGTPLQIWTKVRLPAALPFFFSGLRIAATYSVVGAVVGEWVGASQGLGIYLLRSGSAFKTDQVFGGIFIISLLSILVFSIVFLVERRMIPWYFDMRER
ncbi:MAG: ABC transporter permease [Chloroflexota bacterium]